MTESSALFSRTFLVASACVKWALRLLVLGWLVLGLVWCILHFVIVPRIDDLRPWLEQEASQAMGVGVRIGSMQATSNGLIPSLELKAVRLLDAQNNTLVELPLVVTAVSPRSLLAGGFEQIYIDSPELDVRRAFCVRKETPARVFQQLVDFDAGGGFLHVRERLRRISRRRAERGKGLRFSAPHMPDKCRTNGLTFTSARPTAGTPATHRIAMDAGTG